MKKLVLIIITLSISLFSCNNIERKQLVEKDYEYFVRENLNSDSHNDTTFLNFVFNDSKAKTKKHIKKLINEKKIGQWTKEKIPVLDRYTEVEGYQYNLQINDSISFDALLTPYYTDEVLTDLGLIIPYAKMEDLRPFLTNIYGNYIYRENTEDNDKYYWMRENKQVSITEGWLVSLIGFSDLNWRLKKLEIKKSIDSINIDANTLKKEITANDFK